MPTIHWHLLSPRALEIVAHIAMRLTAGYTHDEVARLLVAEREQLQHLDAHGAISANWVKARMTELRTEIRERGARID